MVPLKQLLNFSIINIDKPSGPTSFQVSSLIKNKLGITKTSHFGTLDPMVSGVLPVALGRACRLNEWFMHKDKTYVGIMRLHTEVDKKKLEATIASFIGKINQLPPVRSRVKRAVREREVKSFDILEQEGTDILFHTVVQAGTYIRKLIHDMGEALGGAHMLELRRTQASIFTEPSYTLYDLDNALEALKKGNETPLRAMLIPADKALQEILPVVQAQPEIVPMFLKGKPVMAKDLVGKAPDAPFYALFHKTTFISIVKKVNEGNIIARPQFVYN
jgi:H/ACA ribonucleoprotein complex subunit 4